MIYNNLIEKIFNLANARKTYSKPNCLLFYKIPLTTTSTVKCITSSNSDCFILSVNNDFLFATQTNKQFKQVITLSFNCANTTKKLRNEIVEIFHNMHTQVIPVEKSTMDEVYDHVLALMEKCGVVLKEGIKDCGVVETKTAHYDLVTVYDGKIEDILIEGIKKKFPEHKFIAEESAHLTGNNYILTDEPTWIIDPIDGTINFVHGLPFVCISVAFVVKKQLELCYLYNPCMDELYTARKGKGAFLNGKQIYASKVKTMINALLAHEVSLASVAAFEPKNIERTRAFVSQSLGIRSLGSAALTLCYVARGLLDAYNIEDLNPWDIAAGALLVIEAGGVVIDKSGGEFNIMRPDVITAGTKELSEIILGIIQVIDEKLQKVQ